MTTLPAGVFDGPTSLSELDLRDNHLVGLTRNDALFAGFASEVDVLLDGQIAAARLTAAVPLMLSSADSTRQGFVRVVNGSEKLGGVRVFAFDDGGHAPDPIEIQGLNGTLGDGAGKWRLFITAGSSVVGVSLLESVSGHLTNISTAGVAGDDQ